MTSGWELQALCQAEVRLQRARVAVVLRIWWAGDASFFAFADWGGGLQRSGNGSVWEARAGLL